jgi:hypothetical protein
MMLDENIVAVSPTSTWRVLNAAGLLRRWNSGPSKKGKGFAQPSGPHRHWHTDISYINVSGTFYYLCSVLDGYSRFIVHWELREQMTEAEVEVILQRARELFPQARPRVISDNGPQFIAKDFKEFIRIAGMTHVRTAPYYPQSNGKIERWHKSLKSECIRPGTPLSHEDAQRLVSGYVEHYNTVRLHSAIGYVTPKAKLEGKEDEIFRERDQKLESARETRRLRRAGQKDRSMRADVDPAPPASERPESHSEVVSSPSQPEAEAARENGSEEGASRQAECSGATAPSRIEDLMLRRLRNEVDILSVISGLDIETKKRGARITFRCPGCGVFHTATKLQTNLARCFRCARNFNPIDLVMAERGSTFLDAVNYLKDHLAPWTS